MTAGPAPLLLHWQALITADPRCYREFIGVMCNSDIRETVSTALFNAARRCVGLNPSCDLLAQPGNLLPANITGLNGTNATTNATANATGNATSGSSATALPAQPAGATTSPFAALPGVQAGAANGTPAGARKLLQSSNPSYAQLAAAATAAAPSALPSASATTLGPPDPFALMPRPDASVALATPEEIEQAVQVIDNTTTAPSVAATPAGKLFCMYTRLGTIPNCHSACHTCVSDSVCTSGLLHNICCKRCYSATAGLTVKPAKGWHTCVSGTFSVVVPTP